MSVLDLPGLPGGVLSAGVFALLFRNMLVDGLNPPLPGLDAENVLDVLPVLTI
jgi:hypothetical protein